MSNVLRCLSAARLCIPLAALAAGFALPAQAARIGVLSNMNFAEAALYFGTKIPSHTFTPVDVSLSVPTAASLVANFDAILLFEDSTFAASKSVGNVVAQYAQSGRAVVLGTFYDQDRSDGDPANTPHGWGTLENIDPNTADGFGTPYAPRTLNVATMVAHPLTSGIKSLASQKFAGGNQAKTGTTVVAYWNQPNARGNPDPAIAYRVTGAACVIHVAIAPNYPLHGTAGVDYDGDFDRTWKNAFDFASRGCTLTSTDGPTNGIPATSGFGIGLTALSLAAVAFRRRRALSRY